MTDVVEIAKERRDALASASAGSSLVWMRLALSHWSLCARLSLTMCQMQREILLSSASMLGASVTIPRSSARAKAGMVIPLFPKSTTD